MFVFQEQSEKYQNIGTRKGNDDEKNASTFTADTISNISTIHDSQKSTIDHHSHFVLQEDEIKETLKNIQVTSSASIHSAKAAVHNHETEKLQEEYHSEDKDIDTDEFENSLDEEEEWGPAEEKEEIEQSEPIKSDAKATDKAKIWVCINCQHPNS